MPTAIPPDTLAMPTTPFRRVRSPLALVAAAGPALLVVGDTVASWSRPGYDVLAEPISHLGIGPRPWLLNVPLIACGLGVVAFAVVLRRSLAPLPRASLASGFFALFGVLFAVAGVLPLSDPVDPHPLRNALHFILGFFLGMSALVVALFSTASVLRRGHAAGRGHRRYTLATAALVVALVPATFVFFNPDSSLYEAGIGGVLERLMFLVFLAWFEVTTWRIRQSPSCDAPMSSPCPRGHHRHDQFGARQP
jgi:hypothetical membrane protein